nr:hypothetical protein [Tanacetum cinerariifolium]
HYNISVGDLSPEVTDAMLFAILFCWKWLDSRQIRCNWATKELVLTNFRQELPTKFRQTLSVAVADRISADTDYRP